MAEAQPRTPPRTDGARVLLVVARYYPEIVDALADAAREALANDWVGIAGEIRTRPVGLSRNGGGVTLAAMVPDVGEGMGGWAGRLTYSRYTLAGGRVPQRESHIGSAHQPATIGRHGHGVRHASFIGKYFSHLPVCCIPKDKIAAVARAENVVRIRQPDRVGDAVRVMMTGDELC